jgi:hypothetical protein
MGLRWQDYFIRHGMVGWLWSSFLVSKASFVLRIAVNGRIDEALPAWHSESLTHYRERNLSTSCQVSAPIERVSAP